jgi:ribosome-associated translation inhibitor RaiA
MSRVQTSSAIDIEGAENSDSRACVRDRLRRVLGRRNAGEGSVRVIFSDENGPKGGIDHRCAITVRFPRRREIHAEHTASSERLAITGVIQSLGRRLDEELDRRRNAERRPKKYYAARRLAST